MALSPGDRLGPFEIVVAIGAGGMGEVYKARDTRLGRTVALKVLPATAATDSAMRERFQREGEAIAAVNSPHICALYDVDRQGDRDILVMEYVDGEPLDAVLRRGPLPFAEAALVAIHIAQALEAAHTAGIVHRDLKPSNIMLARGGAKVLDFGIAKLRAPGSGTSQDDATRAALTSAGSIVGTLAYMAPEQLQGLDVDARADLFAFGAVLFEMLTGRAAASAPAALSVPAPAPVQWLIRRCLDPHRESRWQSAHDAAALLQWAKEQPESTPAIARRPPRLGPLAVAAIIVAFTLGAAVSWGLLGPRLETDRAVRLSVVAPPGAVFTPLDASGAPQFALSPDGELLAFVAAVPGTPSRIWLRSLTTAAVRAIEGTEHGAAPFWSPDSRAIGFFARGKLSTIDLDGGRSRAIADVTYNVNGAAWGPQGILFVGTPQQGILLVPSGGGSPRQVTTVDAAAGQVEPRWPQFLDDGRHFIYYVSARRTEDAGVYLSSLDDARATRLVQTSAQARFVSPHWLLFERGGSLVAQRLDVRARALVGEPVELSDRAAALPAPSALLMSGSAGGRLALWDGERPRSSLQWIDRNGRPGGPLLTGQDHLHNPTISADGRHVLVTRVAPGPEPMAIWRIEIATGRQTRLTFSAGFGPRAVWSPDGTRIAFGQFLGTTALLFTKPSSGAGADEPLPLPPGQHYAAFPSQWTADGTRILYQATGAMGWDIWAWDLAAATAHPIVEAPGNQTNARLAPNGRWVAYGSDESGLWQVYVEPFPGKGGKWQVSETSGSQPLWRADGRELYYLDDTGTLIAATVREQPTFEIVDRQPLAKVRVQSTLVPYPSNFAVTPDGQRFLINQLDDTPTAPITIVVNWLPTLR